MAGDFFNSFEAWAQDSRAEWARKRKKLRLDSMAESHAESVFRADSGLDKVNNPLGYDREYQPGEWETVATGGTMAHISRSKPLPTGDNRKPLGMSQGQSTRRSRPLPGL